MGVSLADSRADELRRGIDFLRKQLERLGGRILAGTATADEELFAARLSLTVSAREEELAALESETPTVELHVGELLAYSVE
jgi:hypothetical protein